MPNDIDGEEQQRFNKPAEVAIDLNELSIRLSTDNFVQWIETRDGITIEYNVPNLADHLWAYRHKKNKRAITAHDITTCLKAQMESFRIEQHRNLVKRIAYSPDTKDTFEELAKLLTGNKYDPHYPIVLRHMIWTIKRRINRLPDYCPLFISLYGPAGKGKTESVKAMFSILPSHMLDTCRNVKQIFEDNRETFRFVEYYVCILDEICGLGKTDINNLKNLIDSTKLVHRTLGANRTQEGRNNAQLIGTSNTRLRNIILSDTSDIRKWAEIDIVEHEDDEVPAKLVTPMQKYDWLNLWRSVNENEPCEFQKTPEIYNDFKSWTANKCRHESPTALFIDDMMEKYTGWQAKTKIYDIEYLNAVPNYPKNWANLKEDFEKRGCKVSRKNTGIGIQFPDITMEFTDENITD